MASHSSDVDSDSAAGQDGAESTPVPRLVLTFQDRPIGEMPLAAPRLTIGRRPTCDIAIDHNAVSGTHAAIFVEDNAHVIEDLRSTNGTLVNGLVIQRQVLRHLDVIEIGLHKIHYFDAGGAMEKFAGLETTVDWGKRRRPEGKPALFAIPRPAANDRDQRGFERTNGMVREVVPSREDAAEDKLSATVIMARPESIEVQAAPEPVQDTAAEGAPVASGPLLQASAGDFVLRYVAGPRTGKIIELNEKGVIVGTEGVQVAAVVWRAKCHFLTHLIGRSTPTVNGQSVGPGSQKLIEGDRISVAGHFLEFVRKDAPQ